MGLAQPTAFWVFYPSGFVCRAKWLGGLGLVRIRIQRRLCVAIMHNWFPCQFALHLSVVFFVAKTL
jgi:hypothetical protein